MSERVAQVVVGTPTPALRSFVGRYTGYRYEGFEAGVHVGLPSRYLTCIVSLGEPVDVGAVNDPNAPRQQFEALIGGLHAEPAAVHHDGNQHGVQLEVTPLGARALLGTTAAQIAGVTLPLDALLGRIAGELVDRLRTAPTWSRRFAVLDHVLLQTLTQLDTPSPEVTFAWQRLAQTGGSIEVGSLAAEAGWSRRHLSERFRREYGLPPKTVARVMRFERSRRMLAAPSRPSLGTVAATIGYADQAHMNRDWRELAGSSPGAWMAAERLPFFQDELGDGAPNLTI